MAQTNKQGMRLRQTEGPRRKNTGWLLQTLVVLIGCTMLDLTVAELVGYSSSSVMAVMLVSGIYLCLIYGLLLRAKRPHWFFTGALVLMLVIVLACRGQVLEGYRLFWKQVSDAMVRGTGWVLPEWEMQLPEQQHKLCLMLFVFLISGTVSIISCFLAAISPPVLAVILPGAALFGMGLLGTQLSFVHLLLVMATAVLILLYSGWGMKNAMAPVMMSWLLGAAVAAILLLAMITPGMRTWSEHVGQQMQQSIHKHRYETEHTTLPEGDFTNYQETKDAPETALIVTMETPEMMYLRGFTGSVFEDDTWKPLEKEILAKNKQLLYWLDLNAFDPDSQFSAAAAQLETTRNNVIVQNMGACSRYCYVPFSVSGGDFIRAENLNREGILSDGERVYTYPAVYGGTESISEVLQHLQSSDTPEVLQYRKAESAYRHFVYSFYLQVPEEAKQLLGQQWDEIASRYGSSGSLTLQQAQECVLHFLSQCFPESGTPEDMELPLDVVKGSSYQYATVAALTLRYFGIPARYAEGYLITEQMASSAAPGEPLTVDSSCARAWVEIYQDGIGWIPMELAPGLGEMIREDPNDSTGKGDGDTENEELDPEEAEDDSPEDTQTESPDPDGGSVVRVLVAMLTGLLRGLLIFAAIFLILWLRRKLLRDCKEKKFRDENKKDAVAWIFADTVLILEKLGLDRGNGSVRDLCIPAEERFGAEYAAELKEMIDLNDRAMFSSRPLEESHRECALRFRGKTLQDLHTEVKWYKRLWLKWVRCLY